MNYANVYTLQHSNNSLFSESNPIDFYDPTYTYRLLRKNFQAHGIELNTPDLNVNVDAIFDIYIEGQVISGRAPYRFFFGYENPHISPINADPTYLKNFHRVFTWNESLLNLGNVSILMVPYGLELFEFSEFEDRSIFACMISGNKRFKFDLPNDLYEERFKVIEWYEKNYSNQFYLYGRGWHKPKAAVSFRGKLTRRIKRLASQMWGYQPFPSYRGEVLDKGDIYSKSKFSYCYENVANLKNYITEKIFDSMVYGCVPIYWGADNVLDYIPKDCFIDRRDFKSQAHLHDYLINMTAKEYKNYQENIYRFLRCDLINPFKSETFAKHVTDEIISFLKMNGWKN